jgi:tRNA pseudouridine55 synthase
MQGLLLIDKPPGISSFGVVAKVRGIIKQSTGQRIKVGHSGTLDPAASGLLILAIGATTKKLSQLIKQDKTYLVDMMLGQTSSTGDSEGEIQTVSDRRPATTEVQAVLEQFTGPIMQTPPSYSAIKVNGVRAYQLARRGEQVTLQSRRVTVYKNRLIDYDYPIVKFETDVSSGTYIRSLVADIGQTLGTGAYTSSLRRLSIGEYQVSSAIGLEGLIYAKIQQSLISY